MCVRMCVRVCEYNIVNILQANIENHNTGWGEGGAWRWNNSKFISRRKYGHESPTGFKTQTVWLAEQNSRHISHGVRLQCIGNHVTSTLRVMNACDLAPTLHMQWLACCAQQSDSFTCACLLMDSRKVKLKRLFFGWRRENRHSRVAAMQTAACRGQRQVWAPDTCLTSILSDLPATGPLSDPQRTVHLKILVFWGVTVCHLVN
jgi:hypothetical protein